MPGTLYYESGEIYYGQFVEGVPHGNGVQWQTFMSSFVFYRCLQAPSVPGARETPAVP